MVNSAPARHIVWHQVAELVPACRYRQRLYLSLASPVRVHTPQGTDLCTDEQETDVLAAHTIDGSLQGVLRESSMAGESMECT